LAQRAAAELRRYAAVRSGLAATYRGGSLAMAAAVLMAGGGGSDNPPPPRAPERELTSPEQLLRQADLIQAEMNSIEGPSVRARVERGGQSVIEFSSNAPVRVETSDGGFFSVDARRDDGVIVAVYVPNGVVIPDGAVIDVVQGQHGYYFRAPVSGQ